MTPQQRVHATEYRPITSPEAAMISEALRIGSTPEGLGHAIGFALVRQFGPAQAYRTSDAVARGIQDAMKEART